MSQSLAKQMTELRRREAQAKIASSHYTTQPLTVERSKRSKKRERHGTGAAKEAEAVCQQHFRTYFKN